MTLNRATWSVCHTGRGPGQSSRESYPERACDQTRARIRRHRNRRGPPGSPARAATTSTGCGIGSAVLRGVLDRADAERIPVRLDVLQGSPARRLYERHGFTLEREDAVDAFLVRNPTP